MRDYQNKFISKWHMIDNPFANRTFSILAAVTWLLYCRLGVKPSKINTFRSKICNMHLFDIRLFCLLRNYMPLFNYKLRIGLVNLLAFSSRVLKQTLNKWLIVVTCYSRYFHDVMSYGRNTHWRKTSAVHNIARFRDQRMIITILH